MTYGQLVGLSQNGNVKAFLEALRLGEGTKGPNGFRTMFTGKLFDSYDDHPRKLNKANGLESTAAGAWQFLSLTWDGLVKQYGFSDFSPENQALGAVALVLRRGAIDAVLQGNIELAVKLCNKEWASLPGNPYGQPAVTMDQFLKAYLDAGGLFSEVPHAPAPIAEPIIDSDAPTDVSFDLNPNTEGPQMPAPIIAAMKALSPFAIPALDAVVQVVPQLIKKFGSGSAMAERNAEAAGMILEAAKSAVGAVNEQDVVTKLQGSPDAAQAVRDAIKPILFDFMEVGGGIEAARTAAQVYVTQPNDFTRNPVFWISLLLLTPVYMLLVDVFFIHPEQYPAEGTLRVQVVTGVMAIIGLVAAFWLGASLKRNTVDDPTPRQPTR